jgi:hypothetical protein
MGIDHTEGDLTVLENPNQTVALPPDASPATSALLAKISAIMAETNKKLAACYGHTKSNEPDSDDVANPEAFYEQLELDRQKIQKQTAALEAKETEGEPVEAQLERYERLRSTYESLLEQIQQVRLKERLTSMPPPAKENMMPSSSDQNQLLITYQLARQLCSLQKARRAAVRDLAQQTADAGVSTKFDVHRRLVALATGLKEEELDPMAAELAETLEFDRMNGRGPGGESPEPVQKRFPSQREPSSLPFSGPTVSVDA